MLLLPATPVGHLPVISGDCMVNPAAIWFSEVADVFTIPCNTGSPYRYPGLPDDVLCIIQLRFNGTASQHHTCSAGIQS